MTNEGYGSCIDAFYKCATECLHCENACLDEKNSKELVHCIRLNIDCADACIFAAKIMSSGSAFVNEVCALCASICDSCVEECEKHSHMEHCRKCAEVCRKCAEECRAMSNVGSEHYL